MFQGNHIYKVIAYGKSGILYDLKLVKEKIICKKNSLKNWNTEELAFIIVAVSEVSAYNRMRYFGGFQNTRWEFCKKLAYQLIHKHI